jgi:hypothetical protein
MTDLDLQRFLARLLPEKLTVCNCGNPACGEIYWKDETGCPLPTEWLAIVHEIEAMLTPEEQDRYEMALRSQVPNQETGLVFDFNIIHATWQQRATAMMAVKGKR